MPRAQAASSASAARFSAPSPSEATTSSATPRSTAGYPTALESGIAGIEAQTGVTYSGGACYSDVSSGARAACLGSVGPPAVEASRSAGYVQLAYIASDLSQRNCFAYVFFGTAWHYTSPVICTSMFGFFPVAGGTDRVHVPGSCANVRQAAGVTTTVVACLKDGTQVSIDPDPPIYVDGHIWWSINGHQGWMAHDYLLNPTGQIPILNCTSPLVSGHPLILVAGYEVSELDVLDTSDPLKPVRVCTLLPAGGGRFLAATKLAFWSDQELGTADLAAGTVTATAELPAVPSGGAFSRDGTVFAYHVGDDTHGMSTHLFQAGRDRTLLTRPGIGGHGGGGAGPSIELEFSADGRFLLAVDSLFANFGSGPPNFLIYRVDGALVFQSANAAYGAWAPVGSVLYFLAANPSHGSGGNVESWDPVHGEVTIIRGLNEYVWPKISPDGRVAVFNAYDTAGQPHLWRLDLGAKGVSQLSQSTSSTAAFVSANVIWAREEKPCECGPGGLSAPTGRILSYDLASGHEAVVEISLSPAAWVIDLWTG